MAWNERIECAVATVRWFLSFGYPLEMCISKAAKMHGDENGQIFQTLNAMDWD